MIVEQARIFATAAHGATGQVRKYTGLPYIVHPTAVAALIEEHAVHINPAMMCGAWLHDVVEDTAIRLRDIEDTFGRDIRRVVEDLTNWPAGCGLNRAGRKEKDRQRLAMALPMSKTIKLADLFDNAVDIMKHDPKFGRVFMVEAAALVPVLSAGDPILYRMMVDLVEAYAG
jgi:(p)ppGpp synthase/HD superfamily hydrolase